MVTMRILMATFFFCWAAGVVRADFMAEPEVPPQEKVLSGTLCWENVKLPDGSTVKGRLLLTSGDRQIVLPLTSGTNVRSTKDGETIDVEAFVGKQVKLTAMVYELVRRDGTRTLVKSVTRIQEGV